MYNILLCCSGGMSTSLLVNSMKKAANARSISCNITACAKDDVKEKAQNADIVLLGPQIRFALQDIQATIGPDKKVKVINSMDYGMMDGDKTLSFAIKCIEGE